MNEGLGKSFWHSKYSTRDALYAGSCHDRSSSLQVRIIQVLSPFGTLQDVAGHLLPVIISGNDARRSTYVRMLKTTSDIGTRVVEREHLDVSTHSTALRRVNSILSTMNAVQQSSFGAC